MLVAKGHAVGATVVKEYVAEWRRQRREVFVPLDYPPGDLGEVDFFEVFVDVGGERQEAWPRRPRPGAALRQSAGGCRTRPRYERGSVIVTTNLAFSEWPHVFAGDERLATALIDRLAGYGTIITTKGKSFRLRRRRGRSGSANCNVSISTGPSRQEVSEAKTKNPGWVSFRSANGSVSERRQQMQA